MAENKYFSSDRGALFSIENDVDDEEFLRRRPGNNITSVTSSGMPKYNNSFGNHDNFEEKRLQLLEKKKEIEDRTYESTKRSLSLLRNSEEVGIATAEELLKQREQLERTDRRLTDIDQTLRCSQKHIQGIKSIFGSLKNYVSGKVDSAPLPQYSNDSNPEITPHVRPLSQNIVASSSSVSNSKSSDHPALRVRGLYDSDDGLTLSTSKSDPQKCIDQNIDEIMGSISRLKGLASNLGDEIETQNDLLDNMIPKVDKCDITIQRQNKDIKRLLK